MTKKFISPISIDLGAKNTGVFFAHYESGAKPEEIEKKGIVYTLEKDAYTLLMKDRTAARHARRGYDRRQMAKRLFKLIWCEELKLEWNETVQKTIGFLMNRRGFSFLTETYDPDILSQFPESALKILPSDVKETLNGNIATVLQDLSKDTDAAKKLRESLEKFIYPHILRKECDSFCKNNNHNVKKSLEKVPEHVYDYFVNKYHITELEPAKRGKYEYETKKGEKKEASYNTQQEYNLKAFIKYGNSSIESIKEKLDTNLSDMPFNLGIVVENFNLEKSYNKLKNTEEKEYNEAHLAHLFFAVSQIISEIESGHRHRVKYFEELKEALENDRCKSMVELAQRKDIDVQKLVNLIGNISNLELKPLRKYFNDEKHKEKDYWDEERIKTIFEHWVINQWRVGENDGEDKEENYKELRKKLRDSKSKKLVDFWINNPPLDTIPPYQNQNNRRPPKCQSFILNVAYLDREYSQWQEWLKQIISLPKIKRYLEDYKDQLSDLKNRNQSYFYEKLTGDKKLDSGKRTFKHLDARIFQFILDRVKADDDSLKLNEVYSHAKKIKQLSNEAGNQDELAKDKESLRKTIDDSQLPDELKGYNENSLFDPGSFLHLIYKYYKLRRRAKEGRIFIHPIYRHTQHRGYENSGRYDDEYELLTYCNHKPRHKKHQVINDVAGLLEVHPKKLELKFDSNEKLIDELDNITGLKNICKASADMQKEHRGRLKESIKNIYNKAEESSDIYKNAEKAKKKWLLLKQSILNESDQEQELEKKRLHGNPSAAVYQLAQLHNIAFKERGGNASTCAVCSADNALRMQKNEKQESAKAQRLPAIKTRMFDGGIKRMARIVGKKIAHDKWEMVEKELKDKKICVPIIIECNHFEFEPNLRKIKGSRPKKEDEKMPEKADERYQDKEERIKNANPDHVCPYTGTIIVEGELDHIIPRASQWGTLNDEANLIYASQEGNRMKGDALYSIANLNAQYKENQFPGKKDDDIIEWIIETIGDGSGEQFKFGSYQSFINLTSEQQKAFRHALYLSNDEGNNLCQKVIKAIDNRTRTFVNGTQRYFAQVIADELYKKAKKAGINKNLTFDYYGIEAQSSSHDIGIHGLRKLYEQEKDSQIAKYLKKEGVSQSEYSHLIDAMLAFTIAADNHRGQGGLKLNIPEKMNSEPKTGYNNSLLSKIIITENDCNVDELLKRRNPTEVIGQHRSFTRDTYYGIHFIPLLMRKEKGKITLAIGFNWNKGNHAKINLEKTDNGSYNKKTQDFLRDILANSLKYANKVNIKLPDGELPDGEIKEQHLQELFSQVVKNNEKQKGNYYISWNKPRILYDWMEKYNTASPESHIGTFLESISYRTERIKIDKLETITNTIANDNKFTINLKKHSDLLSKTKITFPAKAEWEKLGNMGEKYRDFFKSNPNFSHPHQHVRKQYSLPVITNEGKFMLERKAWHGEDINQVYYYLNGTRQIINDSDSRSNNNKPDIPVRNEDGSRGEKLAQWAKSKKILRVAGQKEYSPDGKEIDSSQWFKVDKQKIDLPDEVEELYYRIDNSTSPSIRIKLAVDGKNLTTIDGKNLPAFMNEKLCQHGLGNNDIEEEFFEEKIKPAKKGQLIEYKGVKGYNKEIDKAFKTAEEIPIDTTWWAILRITTKALKNPRKKDAEKNT